MTKAERVALIESVSIEDLKKLIPLKEKHERLEKRKEQLEKELASVVREIESLGFSVADTSSALSGKRGKKRFTGQPSLASLIVEIMREKKRPLTINEICDALLKEKNFRTRAKDFKAQIRVMIYRNDKGLFSKPKPGLFELAADARPDKVQPKGKIRKKAGRKGTKKSSKGAGKTPRK